MEDLTIEYTIDTTAITLELDKYGEWYAWYWKYAVLNNFDQPTKIIEVSATSISTDPNTPRPPFPDNSVLEARAKEILETQFYGDESNRAKIKRSPTDFSNKSYIRGGDLKELHDPKPISFSGQVVDSKTGEGISGVSIKNSPTPGIPDQTTTSGPIDGVDGFFTIQTKGGSGIDRKLIFSVKKYGTLSLSISKQDGSIAGGGGVFTLKRGKKDASSSILKAQGTTDEEKQRLSDEDKAEFIEATTNEIISTIKLLLIPYVIKKLLCEPYGVCDPLGLITTATLYAKRSKEAKEKAKEAKEKRKAEKEAKQAEKEAEAEEGL